MGDGKQISTSDQIGAAGVALIALLANEAGHVWHERHIDAGIDGMIELRNPITGEVSNHHLLVQSKAREHPFAGENETSFHYDCNPRDLDYWMRSEHQPVLIVCSHPSKREAFWVHVQEYFADPARRATRRVEFDKATMSFGADLTDRLFAIADPTGRSYTPTPVARHETLTSNLLPVDLPEFVYSYPTTLRAARQVNDVQNKSGQPFRLDWLIWSKHLLAWNKAEGTSLAGAVSGPPAVRPISELIADEKDGERLVVHLLNQALRQDLNQECRWDDEAKMLYCRPTNDLRPRSWSTGSRQGRSVFKGHHGKADPTRVVYYRHAALRWHFVRIDGDWFCEILPDYYFTSNGFTPSRFSAEYRSGIKRLDRQTAVLQETKLWASLLRQDNGMLTALQPTEPILDFGELATFSVDYGINDDTWKREAGNEPSDAFDLFEAADTEVTA